MLDLLIEQIARGDSQLPRNGIAGREGFDNSFDSRLESLRELRVFSKERRLLKFQELWTRG